MSNLGLVLAVVGVWTYIWSRLGYRLRNDWSTMGPGNARLSAVGRFQVARQKAIMKQAPCFRVAAYILMGGGVVLFLVGWLIG